jgi:hypothetical protein
MDLKRLPVATLLLLLHFPCMARGVFGDELAIQHFERKIRPLLVEKCGECHSAEEPEAGLILVTVDGIRTGGKLGPVVIPGKPERSPLIRAIRYTDEVKMPPDEKLSTDEIETLEAWVKSGAAVPGKALTATRANAAPTDEDREFWAFQPPVPPDFGQPLVDPSRCRTPVDYFIRHQLHQRQLSPSEPADKATLLRRVTFDLTGLPPTIEEQGQFLNDDSPLAYSRLVDRLLASPRYGERWGRHWLDVARYADTNGGGFDYVYPNAYHYRDYVIRAWNQDKPYDQFLLEQLAGDLLPPTEDETHYVERLRATGFLTLAPKGLGMQDKEQMRMDVVDDQIDVLGRTLLGMTLACARCHDHKFDPIPTRDYYALAGIFRSTESLSNLDRNPSFWPESPLEHPAAGQRRQAHAAAIKANEAAQTELLNRIRKSLLDDAKSRIHEYLEFATKRAEFETITPPEAHFSLDGLDGSYAYNAQLTNANANATDVVPVASKGKFGNSLKFVGKGDVLKVTNKDLPALQLGAGTDFSIAFWLQAAEGYQPKTADTLFSANYGKAMWFIALRPGAYQGIYLRHYDGKSSVDVKPRENQLTLLIDGQWHHVVIANSRTGSARIYVDGKEVGSVSIAKVSKSADFSGPSELTIGPKTNAFRGNVDDVALWHSVLDESEVADLYEAGGSGVGLAALLQGRDDENARHFNDESALKKRLVPGIVHHLTRTIKQSRRKNLGDVASDDADALFVNLKMDGPTHEQLEILLDEVARANWHRHREERLKLEATVVVPALPGMVAKDVQQVSDTRVHLAGNPNDLGELVARGFPQIVPLGHQKKPAAGTSGRLELAHWVADPQNPLTARVFVNRLWQWHFGIGIVSTSDNFGRQGELPTHPELLDYLALELIRAGWSTKAIHRQILLSATYQQSSALSPKQYARDSANRSYWRMNRRRLDAESVRDSLLAIGGGLNGRMFGTDQNWKLKDFSVDGSNTEVASYDNSRRSVYLPVVRSAVNRSLELFDFGDPNSIVAKRTSTTVAPQALYFMNSPEVAAAAKGLVQCELLRPGDSKLVANGRESAIERIQWLHRAAYGRVPTEAEIHRCLRFLGDEVEQGERWHLLSQALLCANEFIYVD